MYMSLEALGMAFRVFRAEKNVPEKKIIWSCFTYEMGALEIAD